MVIGCRCEKTQHCCVYKRITVKYKFTYNKQYRCKESDVECNKWVLANGDLLVHAAKSNADSYEHDWD